MDLLHLHLLLNHVPVIGAIGSLLLMTAAVVVRSRDLAVAGLVSAVVVALIAIPVFLTGEPAEDRVEHVAGVNKGIIETHEEAAQIALAALIATGVLALIALIVGRVQQRIALAPVAITIVAAVVASVLMARAANLGGEIRHTELGGTTTPAAAGETAGDDD